MSSRGASTTGKPGLAMTRLDYPSPGFDEWIGRVRSGAWQVPTEVSELVGRILADIEKRRDDALVEWTNRLDERRVKEAYELEVSAEQLERAGKEVAEDVAEAMRTAHFRIEAYHSAERAEYNSWQHRDRMGITQGRILRPVRSSGAYVPGGKASYPSSVLMNLVPARVAGVSDSLLCSPWPEGLYSCETLVAAQLAGCGRIYSLGGAVAIGAMAFGTETLPSRDVISGPGNIWVAEAKRQVFGRVGVDMLAGPSEVLIIADETARPDWVAADLCAQAEHDPEARAMLLTDSSEMLDAVLNELEKMVRKLERSDIIRQSLENRGMMMLVDSLVSAVDISNRIAPEHLQLAVNLPESLMEGIECAGAIFLGHAAGEVFGDYITGSNHILPTGGTASFSSSLSVSNFMTEIAFIDCTPAAAAELAEKTRLLADTEGLTAHALAASLRK